MSSDSDAGKRLRNAVGYRASLSRTNLMNALFAWAFKGLVYPQIWEDPEIDMEALAITPDCHVVTIASGGCNVLSYLTADPRKITAVDLNAAHVALNRLKLAAATHLPSWPDFYRFFGAAKSFANVAAYERSIRPHLDGTSRAYWEGRRLRFGGRRISIFARNAYRFGLLGRCIGVGHFVARAYGVNPRDLLNARSASSAIISRPPLRRCSSGGSFAGRSRARSRYSVSAFRPRNTPPLPAPAAAMSRALSISGWSV